MIAKERLLAITNLKLAGKIEEMNDEQLQQYDQQLITFIETFPAEEEKIKAALNERLNDKNHYEAVANGIYSMCRTLEKLHADDMVKECRQQIEELKHAERDQLEAFVVTFLSAVAMLSIDIQMAKYLEEKKYTEKKEDGAAEAAFKAEELAAEHAVNAKSPSEKVILAVDDAAISLSMLKKNLQGAPYKLICVNSGKDALIYLKRHQPDLFILDIEMPRMNGYELAEKIKELGQKAPIIFLTGNATKRNVMRAIEAGASDFIVKPIDNKYFLYKIRKFL